MFRALFRQAMAAPGRQLAFRRAATAHLLVVAALFWALERNPTAATLASVGHALLAAGIIQGAFLVGWRLTQLPKSQALEFLLTAPQSAHRVFFAEAVAGLARLGLVALTGLPILVLMLFSGRVEPFDLVPLLLMPFSWGAVTGIGLTVWAYEAIPVRRTGELLALGGVLLYLAVGVVAGERLREWLQALPSGLGESLFSVFQGFHQWNPFGVLQYWLGPDRVVAVAWERMAGLQAAATLLLLLLLARAAFRMKPHFHDRHYRPITDERAAESQQIGERPLSWWAVRRVMEYSGRVNLWLAGGFGVLYAAYLVAGDAWPAWMGRLVFQIFERMGGAPVLVTGLVILAAVPAAFQYGLWDASPQDRCRRLELLLLTELNGSDYWHAARAAAWRRGRGYFAVAVLLWLALGVSGRAGSAQVLWSMAAGIALWWFAFTVGFAAFSRGAQANGLGSLLTLGLPLLTFAAVRAGYPQLGGLLPPGAVYLPLVSTPTLAWLAGPAVTGAFTLWLARRSLPRCEDELRAWYDRIQGKKVME